MKNIAEKLPSAAGAAILASAVSAFIFTIAFDPQSEKALIYSFMLLSAVFTAAFRLAPVPGAVRAAAPVICAAAGAGLMFVRRGGISLYSLMTAGADIPVSSVIAPCVLLSAAVCMTVCAVNSRFVTRCAAAGGIALALAVFAWLRIELLVPPAMLLAAYPVIVLCQLCSPKDKTAGQERYDVWFVVFSLAVSAAVFALPSPDTRIQWEKIFGDSYSEKLDILSERLDVDKISDSKWGSVSDYSDDPSNLGGWLELRSGARLRLVFSDPDHPDRLTGGIYDAYTGSGWQSETEIYGTGYFSPGGIPDVTIGENGVISGSDIYGSVYVTSLFSYENEYVGSGTVFYPAYTVSVFDAETGCPAERNGKRLSFASGGNSGYTAYYMKRPAAGRLTGAERERYLALPEKLPARVTELALEVTENCATDEQKAQALTEYIGRNYTYSTEIKKIPARRDLVDSFMFVSRKGYCEYFASAMAVSARCAGIPSRYVMGYLLHGDGETYTVLSSSAHAWAELYIEGRGWVVYDPLTQVSGAVIQNEETPDGRSDPRIRRLIIFSYIAIAAGALLSALLKPFLLRLMWRLRLRGKYRGNTGKASVLACGRLLWVLSACGIKRDESETLAELGERIGREHDWLGSAAAQSAERLLAQTGKALYSPDGCAEKPEKQAPSLVRRAYIKRFGLARYLRGHNRASL